MRSLFFELLKGPLRSAILMWGSISIAQIVIPYFFKSDIFAVLDVLDFVAVMGIPLASNFQLAQEGSLNLIRSTSKNSKQFWNLRILLTITIILINTFIFALKTLNYSPEFWKGLFLLLPYSGWFVIGFVLFNFLVTTKGTLQDQITSLSNLKRSMMYIFSFYIWFGIFIALLHYTALGAFALGIFSIWTLFSFKDIHMQQLVFPSTRRKIWSAGITVLTTLTVFSIFFFSRNFKQPDEFLGILGPSEKSWVYEDLNKVSDAKDWLSWYRKSDRPFTIDEALSSISKITALCHQRPSDDPLEINCYAEKSEPAENFFDQNWELHDIEKFLKSESPYARILGLVQLRKTSRPFSESIISLVKKYAEIPGALSIVAATTLEAEQRKELPKIRIRVRSQVSNTKPEN